MLYQHQVPPISIAKVIADTVASSNGMLVLQNEVNEADATFSMEESLFIPGPKHMLDNIIGDMLQKMNEYEAFQSSLKVCCEACTRLRAVKSLDVVDVVKKIKVLVDLVDVTIQEKSDPSLNSCC